MNFRVGFITQSLNQQLSKIHRAMFGRPEWTTIQLADTEMVKECKVAVAMNLDCKTDETVNETTLPKIEAFLARLEILRAAKDIGRGI